jgi:cardiolipin synthase
MVILILYREFHPALVVFTVAGVTDALDGFLARVLKQQTMAGRILDPLADKMLLVSSFVTLSMTGIVPVWLTVIVIARDFIILAGVTLLFMFREGVEIAPSFIGKFTTVLQLASVFFAMTGMDVHEVSWLVAPLFRATAAITVISGMHYMYSGFRILTEEL